MSSRDDFSAQVRQALEKRVGSRCSNPDCRRPTSGPHTDVGRSVSIGVASHITAASPGGPRFDNSLSPTQRSSILNGVWLCQSCAKTIDSDVLRYTSEVLHGWKREAEFQADIEMAGRQLSGYLPQPPSAQHAPIPRMAGLTYDDARARLLEAGWQPRMRHWSHGSDPNVHAGNGREFWKRGYWEIINAWPTGLGQCTFAFHDVYGNFLTVMTQGEEGSIEGWHARVSNWFFAKG
jgi:hypothetical protein